MEKKYYVTPIRYKKSGKTVEYYRIDGNNKTVYYTKYEELDGGFAKVMKYDRWGILNPSGIIWGMREFDSIADDFSEDIIRVYKNGKVGYADRSTGRFIGCVFDSGEDFKNGVAKVCYNGKECTINSIGKIVHD